MTQNYDDILPADSLSSSLDKIENRDDTLRDLFAGTSEPGSPVAYQLWADTTTNKIKQRNAANNAWVTLGDLVNAEMGHLRIDGTNTMSASLNFNTNKGINCTDPALAQDVATKNYVDTTASSAGSARLYATVDTTAGSSTGLVTPVGSSLATIAWSSSISSGITVATTPTTDLGKITVGTAGTYFISIDATASGAGLDQPIFDLYVRKPAGSTGTIISQSVWVDRGYDSPNTLTISTIVAFSALDTFDIPISLSGGPSPAFYNNALFNRISMFRLF